MRFERRGFSVFTSGREMRRAGHVHTYVKRERKKKQMNKITRKGFLKIAAAAAMSGVTAGALAACESAGSAVSGAASAGSAPAARPSPAPSASITPAPSPS